MTSGDEDGVYWEWKENLDVGFFKDAGDTTLPVHIAAHPVHSWNVAGVGGNQFYGNYYIVRNNGSLVTAAISFSGNPTKYDHTEPQYFSWLKDALEAEPAAHFVGAQGIILEIAQTNTPCSSRTCRPAILNCLSSNSVCGFAFNIVVARMSAYRIYEHQPPKVCPTSREISIGKKDLNMAAILFSQVLHRYPEDV